VLTAFILVCLVLPSLVRHRSQFYAALACVAGIILVHTLIGMFGFVMFGGIAIGVLQFMALLLLVLCVGGLTVKELAGDMARAYEVIRRGETEKEVIIPIKDQPVGARRPRTDAPSRKVYNVSPPAPAHVDDDEDEDKGIPLS
jgi:hypothetical protein